MSRVYVTNFNSSVETIKDYWKDKEGVTVKILLDTESLTSCDRYVLIQGASGFRKFEEEMYRRSVMILAM